MQIVTTVCLSAFLVANAILHGAAQTDCGSFFWWCPEDDVCISMFGRCDGLPHCSGGSDEVNCDEWDCLPSQWKCKNSSICIPQFARCDGKLNCPDGEDELNCESWDCWSNMRKCNDNKQCFSSTQRCDGETDCFDWSDEIGCIACTPKQALCEDSGQCIDGFRICDGVPNDCTDGSDERNCNSMCLADELLLNDTDLQLSNSDSILECPFGSTGPNCSAACVQCLLPLCKRDPFLHTVFDVTLGNSSQCVPLAAEWLTIRNSKLFNLTQSTFWQIKDRIKFLKLNSVSAANIETNAFADLKINFLYLNYMGLTTIILPNIGITTLLILNLDNNRLETIPNELVFTQLISLSVNRNKIQNLSNSFSDGLPKSLETLYLHHNCIQIIGLVAFKRLSEIELLDLRHNQIQTLALGLFRNQRSLRFLYLQGNNIRQIPSLVGLPGRVVFYLDANSNCTAFPENITEWRCRQFPNSFPDTESFFLIDQSDNCNGVNCSRDNTCVDLLGSYDCPGTCEVCNFDALRTERCQTEITDMEGNTQGCDLRCSCSNDTLSCSHTKFANIITGELCIPPHITSLHFNNVSWSDDVNLQTFLSKIDNLNFTLTIENQDAFDLVSFLNQSSLLLGLKKLSLRGNNIQSVPGIQIDSLQSLDLSGNRVTSISNGNFAGLPSLQRLNLSGNAINRIEEGPLINATQIRILDIRNNQQSLEYPHNLLKDLSKLEAVYGDVFWICCLPLSVTSIECVAPQDKISSCDRLIRDEPIRVLLWIQSLVATIGNVVVFILRAREYRMKTSSSSRLDVLFIAILSLADLCMGIYLTVIASVDQFYANDFYVHSSAWIESPLCKFSGALSLFSSQASVFTLLVITLTRCLSVLRPMYFLQLNKRIFRFAIALVWFLALIMATLPLYVFPDFFSDSALCLPKIFSTLQDQTWWYTMIIMITNMLAFLIMIIAYVTLVTAATRNSFSSADRRRSGLSQNRSLGYRVFFIIATDCLCWVPICAMAFASLGNVDFSSQEALLYPITAVILLPINSAMNPLIYTFLSHCRCTKLQQTLSKYTTSSQK